MSAPFQSPDRVDVSVVCPFFNEAGIIEHAIRQMLEQLRTLPGSWELIVVNDGSTDQTRTISERFGYIRLINQENKGLSAARNVGIAAAEGEIRAGGGLRPRLP